MKIKYVHTNIISKDWKKLAYFYIKVFECKPLFPERDQKGSWLDKGTGLKNAHIKGIHLQLPGYEKNGPTLEIFEYSKIINSEETAANKQGYGHIAFHVENINSVLDKAILKGAEKIGEISQKLVEGIGLLTFIYIRDPEANIIELQNWS